MTEAPESALQTAQPSPETASTAHTASESRSAEMLGRLGQRTLGSVVIGAGFGTVVGATRMQPVLVHQATVCSIDQ